MVGSDDETEYDEELQDPELDVDPEVAQFSHELFLTLTELFTIEWKVASLGDLYTMCVDYGLMITFFLYPSENYLVMQYYWRGKEKRLDVPIRTESLRILQEHMPGYDFSKSFIMRSKRLEIWDIHQKDMDTDGWMSHSAMYTFQNYVDWLKAILTEGKWYLTGVTQHENELQVNLPEGRFKLTQIGDPEKYGYQIILSVTRNGLEKTRWLLQDDLRQVLKEMPS